MLYLGTPFMRYDDPGRSLRGVSNHMAHGYIHTWVTTFVVRQGKAGKIAPRVLKEGEAPLLYG